VVKASKARHDCDPMPWRDRAPDLPRDLAGGIEPT
jgi:hypothetical protein